MCNLAGMQGMYSVAPFSRRNQILYGQAQNQLLQASHLQALRQCCSLPLQLFWVTTLGRRELCICAVGTTAEAPLWYAAVPACA